MIPISDIISIFENDVPGVDSVRVSFAADIKNTEIYGKRNGKLFDGIDEFGDIILTRTITDHNGQFITVKDILPLFRGRFTDKNGIEYSEEQNQYSMSAYNIKFAREKSSNRQRTLTKYTPLT